jgi:uroporphyrin-III C-methyltransferase
MTDRHAHIPASSAIAQGGLCCPVPGQVAFVGAGPGDAELLTLKALKALQAADVILHDRLVSDEVLDLAGEGAVLENVGKEGFGPQVSQEEINTHLAAHAAAGKRVVRLKAGDPAIFARLDEEITALEAAQLAYVIVPGITAASAAAASIGQSLTQRGRNTSVRFVTGHDMKGFADQDWAALAQPEAVAAVYMGKKSARFIQGRMLMHGADRDTPVTVLENASRADQRVLETTLGHLADDLAAAAFDGPALTFLGLAPRKAAAALTDLKMELA